MAVLLTKTNRFGVVCWSKKYKTRADAQAEINRHTVDVEASYAGEPVPSSVALRVADARKGYAIFDV